MYRNPLIEAMRLSVAFGDVQDRGVAWPLPDFWLVVPALDLWRLRPGRWSC